MVKLYSPSVLAVQGGMVKLYSPSGARLQGGMVKLYSPSGARGQRATLCARSHASEAGEAAPSVRGSRREASRCRRRGRRSAHDTRVAAERWPGGALAHVAGVGAEGLSRGSLHSSRPTTTCASSTVGRRPATPAFCTRSACWPWLWWWWWRLRLVMMRVPRRLWSQIGVLGL